MEQQRPKHERKEKAISHQGCGNGKGKASHSAERVRDFDHNGGWDKVPRRPGGPSALSLPHSAWIGAEGARETPASTSRLMTKKCGVGHLLKVIWPPSEGEITENGRFSKLFAICLFYLRFWSATPCDRRMKHVAVEDDEVSNVKSKGRPFDVHRTGPPQWQREPRTEACA